MLYSGLATSVNEKKKKRKCCTVVSTKRRSDHYIRVNPLPRILKRDIRREYANMFINMHNAADGNMIRHYFDELCVEGCNFFVDIPMAQKLNSLTVTNVQGREKIAACMIHYLGLFPDAVLKLYDHFNNIQNESLVQIVQREGLHGCKIRFHAVLRGTVLYNQLFHEYLPLSPVSIATVDHCHLNSHNHCATCYHMKQYSLLCSPVELICQALITLHLNEQHRIQRITIDCTENSS